MSKPIKSLIFCFVILIIAVIIYLPALDGGFLFDDFNNLYLLAIMDGQLSLENIYKYLDGQKSGPLGRPISALSFLMDGMNWPVSSERPFKITNLVIHLINTALLFALLVRLFSLYKGISENRYWLAFTACSLWALHPFFVSTTMYVVQRMAMLPATFTLLGMLLYLQGRVMQSSKPKFSVILMFMGVWVCTGLAVLSKENGVLLLLLIWLFEYLVLRKQVCNPLPKSLYYILIVSPSLLFIFALVYKYPQHVMYYDMRSFDLYERLLTESRVIFKYLYYIWAPDYLTEGVFNDGIAVSKGLLQPVTTIFSVFGVFSLLLFAWLVRSRMPLISFCILFYFIGHLIESTYLPLELYFEHRNYLPAMFMFVPVALLTFKLKHKPKLYYTIPCIIILFFSFFTFMRSNMWGNNFNLHYETAMKFPESARAANTTASLLAWEGDYVEALEMLEYGISNTNRLQLKINRVSLLCELNTVQERDLYHLNEDMQSFDFIKDDLTAFRDLLYKLLDKQCFNTYGAEYTQKFLQSFKNNALFEKSATARKYYYFQNATVNAKLNKLDESLESYKSIIHEVRSLNSDPVFQSTALEAVDYLMQYDSTKSVELAKYYKNYCMQNFKDCDTLFIDKLDKKVQDESKDITDYSGQE